MSKEKKTALRTSLCVSGALLVVLGVAQPWAATSLEAYLHENAILAVPPLSSPPPPDVMHTAKGMPIAPRDAVLFAIAHGEAKGITNIVICEVHWIAAPLTGYLVDLLGVLTLDREEYTTFRIGIADGLDEDSDRNPAGKEFVFLALGRDTMGETFWFPRPGPDYRPAKDEAVPDSFFTYEFLLERERFETLYDRYR